ncbi:MAG: hypothetical protein H0Z34_12575 [Brevibacillus sp.]|nr:hypothetical protein [Brevibacillus sp.]
MIGRIEWVTSSEKLEELYRLRYKVFVEEEAHLPPSPDGRLTDRFDAYPSTRNLAAYVGDSIVAGLRMSLPSVWGMPADEFFDFAPYIPDPLSQCAGGSMLCISRRCRRSRALFTGLLGMFYYWAKSCGLKHVYAVANPERASFFVKSGFRCLTPPFYHEEKRLNCLPVVLSMEVLPDPYRTFVEQRLAAYGPYADFPYQFDVLERQRAANGEPDHQEVTLTKRRG